MEHLDNPDLKDNSEKGAEAEPSFPMPDSRSLKRPASSEPTSSLAVKKISTNSNIIEVIDVSSDTEEAKDSTAGESILSHLVNSEDGNKSTENDSNHPSSDKDTLQKMTSGEISDESVLPTEEDRDKVEKNESIIELSEDQDIGHSEESITDDEEIKVIRVVPSPIFPVQPPGINAPAAPPGIRGAPRPRASIHDTTSANLVALEGSSSAPPIDTRRPTDDNFLEEVFPSNPVPPPVAPRTTIGSSASTSDLASRPTTSPTMMSPPSFSQPPLPTTHQNTDSSGPSGTVSAAVKADKCNICMDAAVNAVLYTCGHMCMCYECARRLHASKGVCPICRAPVQDVEKT